MSKKKKLTPGGPPKGKIIVNSATWGMHERWARGTHTPAPVNEAFNKASSTLHKANPYARLINEAIKPFNSNLRDGTLWSRLTKHFYPFIESNTPVDFRSLGKYVQGEIDSTGPRQVDSKGRVIDPYVPIHKTHRLYHTLIFREVEMTADAGKNQLHVSVKGLQLKFTNSLPDIDGAHLTMIALFIGDRNEYVETRHQAAMLELDETQADFELPIPANTGVVLLCMKCEAYHNGSLSGNTRTMGMDFVKAEALLDIAVVGEVVSEARATAAEVVPEVAEVLEAGEVSNEVPDELKVEEAVPEVGEVVTSEENVLREEEESIESPTVILGVGRLEDGAVLAEVSATSKTESPAPAEVSGAKKGEKRTRGAGGEATKKARQTEDNNVVKQGSVEESPNQLSLF